MAINLNIGESKTNHYTLVQAIQIGIELLRRSTADYLHGETLAFFLMSGS